MPKRTDYIGWDQCFMGMAAIVAQRSKDPSTQVGAVIVSANNRVLGVGYNGFPNGCADDDFPWGREGDYLETKYPYVVHAEINAIANAVTNRLDGATIYCTLSPCEKCAQLIIQKGIRKIVYLDDKYWNDDAHIAARLMLASADIPQEQFLMPDKHDSV